MPEDNKALTFVGGVLLGAVMVFFLGGRRTQAANGEAPNFTFNCGINLTVGNQGPLVEAVQESLLFLGYDIGTAQADGIFGPGTATAVEAFQSDRGIVVDGVVGPQVYRELNAALQAEGGSFICTDSRV